MHADIRSEQLRECEKKSNTSTYKDGGRGRCRGGGVGREREERETSGRATPNKSSQDAQIVHRDAIGGDDSPVAN